MESGIIHSSERGTIEIIEADGKNRIRRSINSECPVYETLKDNPSVFIPEIFSVTIADGKTVIEEEYSDGKDPLDMDLSEAKVTELMFSLCKAMEYIHSLGIVHRDIKPSNLLADGKCGVKLIDFEAARFVKENAEKDTRYLGTEGFAPPEQYGFSQTDFRADIYAAGQTMKTLLGSLSAKRKYAKIIKKCTEADPDRRYRSAEQLYFALEFVTPKYKLLLAGAVLLTAASLLSSAMFYPVPESDVTAVYAAAETAEITPIEAQLEAVPPDTAPYEIPKAAPPETETAEEKTDAYTYYGVPENIPEYDRAKLIFYPEDENAKILFTDSRALFEEYRKFYMYDDLDGDGANEAFCAETDAAGSLQIWAVYGVPEDGTYSSAECSCWTIPYEFDKSRLKENCFFQLTAFDVMDERLLAFTAGDGESFNFTGFFRAENGGIEFIGSGWGETHARMSGLSLNEYLQTGGSNLYLYSENTLRAVTAYDYAEYYDDENSLWDIYEEIAGGYENE